MAAALPAAPRKRGALIKQKVLNNKQSTLALLLTSCHGSAIEELQWLCFCCISHSMSSVAIIVFFCWLELLVLSGDGQVWAQQLEGIKLQMDARKEERRQQLADHEVSIDNAEQG